MRIQLLAAAALIIPTGLAAQSLAARVANAPDGQVHFSYAARPGVCGNGTNSISVHDRDDQDWVGDCESGPVRVALTVAHGQVERLHTYVGGHWRQGSGTDLGMVRAADAADYLLDLGSRISHKGGDAIFAATLADSVEVWPRLVKLAQNQNVPKENRRSAIFWLGQAAGDRITASLDSIAMAPGEREIRDAAVFALSQRPHDEGVPALINVARTNPDPQTRRKALFWLGQSEDPRAVALFEEILEGN
ncbi:MAG TPA: HEAT repeat domain-containing protein [Gemmatimonadales bacterium]|nr:HEAT repeat domain-containing protein [Gemmatimonadales bacterium]